MRKIRVLKSVAVVIVMLFVMTVTAADKEIFANNYYQESLYFDEEGNFFMTTHDIVATKSTRYCTLGWTIKRYNLPINDPLNMCATIVITCDGSVEDPENERYLYSFFYCDKSTIFEAIGSISEEWQRELYLNGGTVYLDGIMTVIENNVTLGSLYLDGSRRGEVYDTYEGIVSARGWGPNSKNSLRTHFNKSVYFPAVEGFFEEGGDSEITREKGKISENYYWWGPDLDASVSVSADGYNPSEAIPAGEAVRIYGWQQSGAYNIEYEMVSGKTACEIPIILTATRPGTDESGQEVMLQVQISEGIYQYMVPYTYYALESVELYYADGVVLSSDVFGRDISLDTGISPDIDMRTYGDDEHVRCKAVEETVTIDIGLLTDEEEIRTCIEAALQGVANKAEVRNDYLSIGENIVMTDEWTERASTPEGVSLSRGSASVIITIPATTPNAEYSIKAKAYYGYMTASGYGTSSTSRTISNAGKITVHTPVVCYGEIEDVKEWNQAEHPSEEKPMIVLGKDFAVLVFNEGKHIDAKGYGTRDYKEYVLYNQVRFPFDVFDEEGKPISAGTWVEVKPETRFLLPVTVPEGEYDVEFRAVASNYEENFADGQNVGQKANLSPKEHIAMDTVTVTVTGQLYDFELTELIGYKSVVDLEVLMEKCDVSALPLIWDDGLPLGSYFRFRFKSVGGYDKGAKITIVPSFWYIDGGVPVEADIYYEDIRYDGKVVLKKLNTEGYKIELTEEDCQIVDGSIVKEGEEGQDYERYQLWSGSYMLPMKSFCLLKESVLPLYGVDKRSFVEDGQILVKFDIRIEDENGENVLLYINSENAAKGYCNRWQSEGGNDGEVIVYNIGESVKDGMKVTGTH